MLISDNIMLGCKSSSALSQSTKVWGTTLANVDRF